MEEDANKKVQEDIVQTELDLGLLVEGNEKEKR